MPSVGQVLREFHIPWPAADEGSLREAAALWQGLAEAIRAAHGSANSAAASLTGSNEGQAIEAFEKYWDRFGGARGALPAGAKACAAMSEACSKYADAVATAKSQIEEAAAELVATLAVGTAFAIVTFYASEAAADALAASLVGTASNAIIALGTYIETAVAVVSETVAEAIGELAAAVAASVSSSAGVLSAAGAGALSSVVGTGYGDMAGDAAVTPTDVTQAAEGGLVSGGLSDVADMGAQGLSQLLKKTATPSVQEFNQGLYQSMLKLADQLGGMTGKVSAGLASTAASQLVVAQQLNAEGGCPRT
jgi:hypothetical protein